MVFKIDDSTNCEFLYFPLRIILRLRDHQENLVKATVNNIAVSCVNLCSNKSLLPFIHSFDFHQFILYLVKNILENVQEIEKLVLKPQKENQLQNKIMDLHDMLEFTRDLILSLKDKSIVMYQFGIFVFSLFLVVQVVLPLLRYDLKLKPYINIGLNCGLFLLNNLLEVFKNTQEFEQACLLPVFFKDKVLSPWVKDFNFQLIDSSENVVNFFYQFHNLNSKSQDKKKFSLFSSKPKRTEQFQAKSSIPEPVHHAFNNSNVEIDLSAPSLPQVYNINDEAKLNNLKRGTHVKHQSKLLECLICFLKTKDDNMLLMSTNILLQLLKHYDLTKPLLEQITDKCMENLVIEMKFRLITFENMAKLLARAYDSSLKHPKKVIIEGLKQKIGILNQLQKKPQLNKKMTEIFKRIIEEYDYGEKMFNLENLLPRERNLNFLSLINYSFYEDFKNLKYISFFYKYEMNEAEVIEMEVKKFIILKNLRYKSKT